MLSPLMEQFIKESRDLLQGISETIVELESSPEDRDLMNELFRLVHTLKGSSGIFEEFSSVTRMLHAAEDLMDSVREGKIKFDSDLTDAILEAMDLFSEIIDEVEKKGSFRKDYNEEAKRIEGSLREFLKKGPEKERNEESSENREVPEEVRKRIEELGISSCFYVRYNPEKECFFKGEDPFFLVRKTPGLKWGKVSLREPLKDFDIYSCLVSFELISQASKEEIEEHFQYVRDQVSVVQVEVPERKDEFYEEIELVLESQESVLKSDVDQGFSGKIESVALVLRNLSKILGKEEIQKKIDSALEKNDPGVLIEVIQEFRNTISSKEKKVEKEEKPAVKSQRHIETSEIRTLKVDTEKVDRLMNLVAEIVVAKNSLLYLSKKAEEEYGIRELSRELKNKYAVFDRIVEEMQDAVSQIRMMPISMIFQRIPRIVRDLSKKLGKKVELELSGEETEADKNIIESISEPLIHIIRNSLDHGIESPEERRKKGKPETGKLVISAYNETDRVCIEVKDDGRGIDPKEVKMKAYERGLISEDDLENMSDKDAINLIFLPGFSTAEKVSDISGRGVGMDVVKNAVEKVGGAVYVETEIGKGTSIKLSLPLSMAVTKVMIIESASQIFGIPMDCVVESVRVGRGEMKKIRKQDAAVLRGKIIPLYSLNEILGIDKPQIPNEDDEFAVLVLRINGSKVGLIVDSFKGTMDIILKPFQGILGSIPFYAGSAILGDGSVLIVLNPKEFWHAC